MRRRPALKSKPLRNTLFIGLPAILLLLAITAVFWFQASRWENNLRQETLSQASIRARQVNTALSENISVLFSNVDAALHHLISHYIDHGNTKEFHTHVDDFIERFPSGVVMQVAVIGADGFMQFSNLANASKVFLGDREHFKVHLDNPQSGLFVSKPLQGRVSKKWSIQFTRPIVINKVFKGVMVLSVAPEYLYRTLENLSRESDDLMVVVRDSGEIMARNWDFENSIGHSTPPGRPYLNAPSGSSGQFQANSSYDDVPRLFHWTRLKDYPAAVVLGMSMESLTRHIDQAIANERLKVLSNIVILWCVALLALYTSLRMRSHLQRRIEAEHAANHDALTGLPNRKALMAFLDQVMSQTSDNRQGGAIMFIDLDNFKQINDTHGHAAGDAMLVAVAQRLKRSARDTDFVARLAGDEFVVVVPGAENAASVDAVVARIEQSFKDVVSYNGQALTAGASIGIVHYPDGSLSSQELLHNADQKMYEKKSKKNNSNELINRSIRESADLLST